MTDFCSRYVVTEADCEGNILQKLEFDFMDDAIVAAEFLWDPETCDVWEYIGDVPVRQIWINGIRLDL